VKLWKFQFDTKGGARSPRAETVVPVKYTLSNTKSIIKSPKITKNENSDTIFKSAKKQKLLKPPNTITLGPNDIDGNGDQD